MWRYTLWNTCETTNSNSNHGLGKFPLSRSFKFRDIRKFEVLDMSGLLECRAFKTSTTAQMTIRSYL